jgi:peptidoglycan hydrolase CwlO-like protein
MPQATKDGGENTIRWHLVVAVTLGLFLLQPAGPSLASEEADESTNTRIKIRRLEHGIQQQLDQLQANVSQERNILGELQALDQRLSRQQDRLAELEEQISGQQQRIDREEASLQAIRTEKARVEEHLQKRATAYYTMGNTGLLNVTFSTKSLPELLTFNDAFETLISYDQEVIRVYRETIVEQERVRSTLALEKVVLEDFYGQAKQERDNLEATKSEKTPCSPRFAPRAVSTNRQCGRWRKPLGNWPRQSSHARLPPAWTRCVLQLGGALFPPRLKGPCSLFSSRNGPIS